MDTTQDEDTALALTLSGQRDVDVERTNLKPVVHLAMPEVTDDGRDGVEGGVVGLLQCSS